MNFKRNRIRLTLILTTLFLIAVPATASAAGSEGDLTQKADPDGCITDVATAGCTTGKALNGAYSVTVSPDGKSAYVASSQSDAVAVFDRDTTTGKLTQKADPDGLHHRRRHRGLHHGQDARRRHLGHRLPGRQERLRRLVQQRRRRRL